MFLQQQNSWFDLMIESESQGYKPSIQNPMETVGDGFSHQFQVN